MNIKILEGLINSIMNGEVNKIVTTEYTIYKFLNHNKFYIRIDIKNLNKVVIEDVKRKN